MQPNQTYRLRQQVMRLRTKPSKFELDNFFLAVVETVEMLEKQLAEIKQITEEKQNVA